MTNIFFMNSEHQNNYEKMVEKFPEALSSTEYQSACYISAAPMLFYKFEGQLKFFDSPVDWIINWQNKHLSKEDYETDEDYRERVNLEENADYNLTNSMQQMGNLALNLWNGYDYFNLMDCLGSVDDTNYQIVRCAIDIRMGMYKGL